MKLSDQYQGGLPIAAAAQRFGNKHLVVPKANAEEVSVLEDILVYSCNNLQEVIEVLANPSAHQ